MRKLLLIYFLFFSLSSFCQKQKNIDVNKIKIDSICDRYVKMFSKDSIHEAMQLVKPYSTVTSGGIDSLEATIYLQKLTVFPTFGNILSSEFIKEKVVKNIISKRYYIIRMEKYFLIFYFTLYNNGNHWAITGLKYNDDINDIAE